MSMTGGLQGSKPVVAVLLTGTSVQGPGFGLLRNDPSCKLVFPRSWPGGTPDWLSRPESICVGEWITHWRRRVWVLVSSNLMHTLRSRRPALTVRHHICRKGSRICVVVLVRLYLMLNGGRIGLVCTSIPLLLLGICVSSPLLLRRWHCAEGLAMERQGEERLCQGLNGNENVLGQKDLGVCPDARQRMIVLYLWRGLGERNEWVRPLLFFG